MLQRGGFFSGGLMSLQHRLRWIFLIFILNTICCVSANSKEIWSTLQTNDFQVEVEVWQQPDEVGATRTVVIFPPTGGVNRIDRSYANQIFERGQNAIVIKGWTGQDEKSIDLEIHQRLHERALRAFSVVLEKIPQDQNVSVVGTSVGGIFASIIASQFDRPDRVLVITAGAPIPEVIAESDEEGLANLRSTRFKKFGFQNNQEYAGAIEKVFHLDPLKLSGDFKGKKLGVVLATEDTTVPTRHQQNLIDFWQTPEVLTVETDHFWGIVRTWWNHSDWVVNFLIQ
jgi:hypothetical protein